MPKTRSKALVATGPRDVFRTTSSQATEAKRPTTTRALVLRNQKHGVRGGELIAVNRISGREKLDLLAADIVQKSKKAVAVPFKLEQCIHVAESQLDVYLDEICGLEDPTIFVSRILNEHSARTLPGTKLRTDPASYHASLVGTAIHNAYTQASAWKLVCQTLYQLQAAGLNDQKVNEQLKSSLVIRSHFLVLCKLVDVLADMNQQKFAVLATTTPHYQPYFKAAQDSDPDEPEVVFDWDKLRDACRSFLDSIVIELCFPRAPYPKIVLYHILHDAVQEAPKEALRFPQALWDAAGDLSVIIELQELLERPLSAANSEILRQLPRDMPPEYDLWLDAQLLSDKASSLTQNYKNLVFPLEKARNRHALEEIWKCINANYKHVCGKNIDTLWQLEDRHCAPEWHAFYFVGSHIASSSQNPRRKKPLPALKAKGHSETSSSDGGPPPLEELASSDDEPVGLFGVSDDDEHPPGLLETSDSDDAFERRPDDDSESEYDEEFEDELRELRREAMDLAHEIPGFFDVDGPITLEPLDEVKAEGNPFLKLLGSLRGRLFSSNPKMKTAKTGSPSKTAQPSPAAAPAHSQPTGILVPSLTAETPLEDSPSVSSPSRQVTVEADGRGDVTPARKKKHKKPKKAKNKPASPAPDPAPLVLPVSVESSQAPLPVVSPSGPPELHTSRAATDSPAASLRASSINASSITLPEIRQTTGESARKYLQSESINSQKAKVKSRPNHAAPPSALEKKDKAGLFSRFRKDKSEMNEIQMKSAKRSWFSKLTKRTVGYMKQLLRTSDDETQGLGSMKWDHFLKLMTEMGFSIEPSTAGSSVRFDPPDRRDKSITFHKPHPDPTLTPILLRDFSKRLKRHYGWSAEDFLAHSQ